MSKHITEQRWHLQVTSSIDDGRPLVNIVGEDGTNVLQLTRPDESSDLLIAGYIVGLQNMALSRLAAAGNVVTVEAPFKANE